MIYLSFDTEEFDVPKERNGNYNPLREGLAISSNGIAHILRILRDESIRATFFCTSNFVTERLDIAQQIITEGHEIASHGCDHWHPQKGDLIKSKKIIEHSLGINIYGYRQPRMKDVNIQELTHSGYKYNSSLNPTIIPGRYSHFLTSRKPWIEDGIVQIPISVTPYFRLPMFWLGLHHYPIRLYIAFTNWIVLKDGNFNTYFHPWEFVSLKNTPNISYLIRHKSGDEMCKRLQTIISYLKNKGERFGTYFEYANEILNAN